ncbi:MAG: AgmX/PglI C-terminal domain-containing protein [Polyangiaceae bacterium]
MPSFSRPMPRTALVVAPFAIAALALVAGGLAACGGAATPFDQKEPPNGGGEATGGLMQTISPAASAAPSAEAEASFMRIGDVTRAEIAAAPPPPTTEPTTTSTPPAGGPTKTASKNEKGYKSDGGTVPPEKKPSPMTTPPPELPNGVRGAVVDSASGLTEAEVRATILGKSSALRDCYDLGGANFSGAVSLRVAIGPTGTVAAAEVTSSTTHSNQVDSCVLGKVRTMQFPSKGSAAVVSFPIEFGR